ncbi:hypothetical protein LX32DRAFT_172752 [Colletotrichum zoysiae]|uniref:Uncharacterized protein n=1 Tax=Colletotrichum zoysiae TaxID=1216348 RepID=A0AAD9H7Q6_9PEZI|nr:hypothetical protein LX32DRAFT_172752 [Colletotrichum zoysiae]
MRRVLSSEEPHLVPRWSRNCMKIRLLPCPWPGVPGDSRLPSDVPSLLVSSLGWISSVRKKLAIFVRVPTGKTSNCIPGWPQRGRLQTPVDPPAAPGKVQCTRAIRDETASGCVLVRVYEVHV